MAKQYYISLWIHTYLVKQVKSYVVTMSNKLRAVVSNEGWFLKYNQ